MPIPINSFNESVLIVQKIGLEMAHTLASLFTIASASVQSRTEEEVRKLYFLPCPSNDATWLI